MEEKKTFNILKEKIQEHIIKLKNSDLFAIIKESGGFNSVFRDSLFEYSPGVILVDRFYKKDYCITKEVTSNILNEEDETLLKDFISLSKNIPEAKDMNEKDSEEYTKKVNEMCVRVQNIAPSKVTANRHYYKHDDITTIPLKPMTEMEKEEIEVRSILSTSFVLAYFRQMFYDDDFLQGLSIMGIDNEEYLDIIIIPTSQENNIETIEH